MKFLEPWYVPDNLKALDDKLASELPAGHELSKVAVHALAQRQDRDDVLFELLDGSSRVAVVHLTYAASVDSRWPTTEMFLNFATWQADRMSADNAEFNA